jgi:retron-type reverse transcriptase
MPPLNLDTLRPVYGTYKFRPLRAVKIKLKSRDADAKRIYVSY